MVNTAANQEREMRVAVERVVGFAQEFGEAHLNLACHAAFPLSLTPDLLYQIWANFVPKAPWTGVARVLLSRLCKEVGAEMYEMDNSVRNLLLRELKVQFGQERFDLLGEFLLEYVSQRLTDDDPDTQDLRQAQQWTALAYTKPEQAVGKLAPVLKDYFQQKNVGGVLSLSSLVETLSEPLLEAGFESFVSYSKNALELTINSKKLFVKNPKNYKKTNSVMMQYFHWYIEPDGTLWQEIATRAKDLAAAGITALWLPPAYKGTGGGYDVGYGVYDLFDLGEFDQKGSIRTKYGTKEEYLAAIKTAQGAGLQVYADILLNYLFGADETEKVQAVPIAWDNRNRKIGEFREIEAYTKFIFPGRNSQYSSFQWDAKHFNAVNHNGYDWDDHNIYLLQNKQFQTDVDSRHGNYNFLIGCNLDMSNSEVREELTRWGEWYLDITNINGFCLSNVKHISSQFVDYWSNKMLAEGRKNLFIFGEYWSNNILNLHQFIINTEGRISLPDVPLHYNFYKASSQGNGYDLSQILDNTLVQEQPKLAVTFVDNHASQPLQAFESPVENWFKPLAYALILLRAEGYPCIFYPDYFGAHYRDLGRDGEEKEIFLESFTWLLDQFLYARRNYAYGEQYNYFDNPNVIGWTRLGDIEHPQSMAVIMSNASSASKWMEVGKSNTTYSDLTQHISHTITTNEHGWGEFFCDGGSVSVWVEQN